MAPNGELWVGRWNRPGEAREYDVFDGTGRRTGTVTLRPNRQVLALGQRHVYVVATDEDGLQAVERHRLPTVTAPR
jgi:hypothetical protein